MRYVIVHYHIFKNGGTTVEAMLQREFGAGLATLHGPDADATLTGSDLASYLLAEPKVSAVSSHHLRYPKPDIPHAVLFDCCFLRHPLARLHSYYTFLSRREALRESAREFLENLMDAAPHQVSDVQVHQLANSGAFTRPASEHDLDKATQIVRQMAIPGLVSMFDESLVAAEYFLRPAFPTIRLEYIPQNVTNGPRPLPGERLDYLIELWGAELYEKLVRLNQMDLELFRRTRAEVTQRLDRVPRAQERLAEFRSRCEQLAEEQLTFSPESSPASDASSPIPASEPGAPVPGPAHREVPAP
ncbi:MAG TPA: hypothetical protein VG096_21180 [Bryobacteraceae bacterium]|jgi:hypothetical protein|nr:hypothetical protein [Bryobacteraceae bacterium]